MAVTEGDIVVAAIRPPRGEVKRRPGVVVTAADLGDANATVTVVGITTSYRPDDPEVVRLGWRADGQIHTRLRRDSAAAASLTNDVAVGDLQPTGGHLSKAELKALLALLRDLRKL